ncbi:MAG: DUF3613 domain-containing protein [Paraburkholderia sp.]|jgi:hypothetical protein|nr:DUF3613 domain-containing protein [Paraburkholderia sp.]
MKTNQFMDAGFAACFAAAAAFRGRCRRAAGIASAAFVMALAAPALHAQDVDAQAVQASGEPLPNSEVGHSTRAWLELQRSNAEAAPALPMLGAEAGYAYRRYLNSFDTEIPASFGSTVQTGNGQGGGSGSATLGGGGAY